MRIFCENVRLEWVYHRAAVRWCDRSNRLPFQGTEPASQKVFGDTPLVMTEYEGRGDRILTVSLNVLEASVQVTEHLIALGHRKIAYLSAPDRFDTLSERYKGYRLALAYDDETRLVMREVVRSGMMDKVAIGTDFFAASINRVIALPLGVRNTKKAILEALLEPTEMLKKMEREGQLGSRLAYQEELKTLPLGSVWDEFMTDVMYMETDPATGCEVVCEEVFYHP